MPPKDNKTEAAEVKWSRPGPCPVNITPEQFDAIYNDDEVEEDQTDAT